MARATTATGGSAPGATLYGMYILAIAASGLGNLAIRIGAEAGWLSGPAAGVVGALASVPLIIAAVLFFRFLRRDLDEMLQRVVLEGMAFALIIFIPLSALYVNLRTAGVWTPRLDAADILFVPAWLVALGILVAKRRYE